MNTSTEKSAATTTRPLVRMPNLLLISGNGRNVGKTTLICRIIEDLAAKDDVTAIKVSSHFHPLTSEQRPIIERSELILVEETDRLSAKDSSRFLRAGARTSYYIQCHEEGLPILALWIAENIPAHLPVVCESGGLGNQLLPGAEIHLYSPSGKQVPTRPHPLRVVPGITDPSYYKTNIYWTNQQWKL